MGYWAWGMRIEIIKEIEARVSSDFMFTVISCMKRERFRERYVKKEDMVSKNKSSSEVFGSGGPKEYSVYNRGKSRRYEISDTDTI